MPFETTTAGLVIPVSSAAEFEAAFDLISHTEGGGRIELTEAATGIRLRIREGGDEPVHITSADPGNPVDLSSMSIYNVDNVKISHVRIDNTGENFSAFSHAFVFNNVSNLEVSDVTFESYAEGEYDPDSDAFALAKSLGTIRDSNNVLFSNNHISGYYQGVTVLETSGITFEGNTFSEMQGDGIRMGGVQDVEIRGNHFHDWHGVVHTFNHNDMIQMWSSNSEIVSNNITIADNIFDVGFGNGTQTIFMRNELYDTGADKSYIYSNITITGNLIHNSHSHGITVSHADGVVVSDNTVLHNVDAGSTAPRIDLSKSWNVTAENNLSAGGVALPRDATASGNVSLNYVDPRSDTYVGDHVVNPYAGADADLADLRLRPDSPLAGKGSEYSDPLIQSPEGVEPVVTVTVDVEDPQTYVFDAGFSVDTQGFVNDQDYSFVWTLADGTAFEGMTLKHRFPDSGDTTVDLKILDSAGAIVATEAFGVTVEDALYLDIDPAAGLLDQSTHGSGLWNSGAELIQTDTGPVFRIGGKDDFGIDGKDVMLHGAESFAVSLDLRLLDNDGGALLRMGSTLRGDVMRDGRVQFDLVTSGGQFRVIGDDLKINDGGMHNVVLHYSNSDGRMTLFIDGAVADTVPAKGAVPITTSSLVVGSPWHTVVDADIGGVQIAADLETLTEETGVVFEDPAAQPVPEPEVSPELQPEPQPQPQPEPEPDVAGPAEVPPPVTDTAPDTAPDTTPDTRPDEADGSERPPSVPDPAPEPVPVSKPTFTSLVEISAETGLRDLSAYDSKMWNSGARQVDTDDGTMLRIGGRDYFGVSGQNDQLHDLDAFDFSIDLRLLDTDGGTFLRMGSILTGEIDRDGSVWVRLITDKGMFRVDSGDVTIDDGAFHTIGVSYSDADSRLELRINGTVSDATQARGTTPDTTSSLVIGSPWHQTVDADVLRVSFTTGTEAGAGDGDDVAEADAHTAAVMGLFLPPGVAGVEAQAALDDYADLEDDAA